MLKRAGRPGVFGVFFRKAGLDAPDKVVLELFGPTVHEID